MKIIIERNHIKQAIEYLQFLKEQGAVVERIEINYGTRRTTPMDKSYCEWAETEVHDGSFSILIHGTNLE
jgi:ribosomal protein S24E